MQSVDLNTLSARERRARLSRLLREGARSAVPEPLSEGQRAIWYIYKLDPDNSSLNLGEAVRIQGGLDRALLAKALEKLVRRHAALRTRFVALSGEPFQRVEAEARLCLEELAVEEESEAGLAQAAGAFVDRAFDLEREPPYRLAWRRGPGQDDVLVLALHHIVGEFSSLVILIGELFELYRAAVTGEPPRLEKLDAAYGDFVRRQAGYLRSPTAIEDGEYFRSALGEGAGPIRLPGGRRPVELLRNDALTVDVRAASALPEERPSLVSFELPDGMASSVRRFSRHHEVSSYVTMLTAFGLLLARRTGSRELTIGAPMTGRTEARFSNVVGYFDNPLPIRLTCPVGAKVSEVLRQVREAVVGAIEHQAYPLQRIVEDQRALGRARDGALFNTMFVMRQSPRRDLAELTAFGMGHSRARATLGGLLTVESVPLHRRRAQFALALSVAESDGKLIGSWEFDRRAFDDDDIQDWSAAFARILQEIVSNPEATVDALPALSEPEEHWHLVECNATEVDLGVPELLQAGIERQILERPSALAVVDAERVLCFSELDRRATAVARWLLERGLRQEEHVAVVMDKGWEQVVAVLGVLRAGGAYLPIDVNLPADRSHDLVRRGEVRFALTQAASGDRWTAPQDVEVVAVANLGTSEEWLASPPVTDRQLAYTIFTSGSTGRPKGVMIDHRGAVNTLRDVNRRLGVGPADSVLGLSALNFDLSVYDIFGVLGAGGTLILPDPERMYEPAHWVELVERYGISLWNSVPSFLKLAVEHVERSRTTPSPLRCLRAVMLSGDWIPTDLPARFAAVGGEHRFISMGGATEGSVWSIWYEVDRVDESWTSIPYGTPMANQAFHVLDERGEPCPVGVPGELHIGGVGVMMGYWREPELTARALVELPKLPGVSYRTGDLGRRLSNGTIEFLGRTDFQVKIRGFRVETGEIESVLLRHSTVAAAVVVAQKHGDENRLVAYVVTTQPTEAKELRACLGAKLPEYMIPLHWVFLDELPLSANGKVDRKALPAIEDSRAQGAVTAARTPATETERALAKVVGEVLRLESIDLNAELLQLGADSIQVIRIAAGLQELGYQVTSRDLFEASQLWELGRRLDETLREKKGDIGRAPLLPIQRAALSRPEARFSCELFSERALDAEVIAAVGQQLARRHCALRLRVGGETQELVEPETLGCGASSGEGATGKHGEAAWGWSMHREGSRSRISLTVPAHLIDATGFRHLVADWAAALASGASTTSPSRAERDVVPWARHAWAEASPSDSGSARTRRDAGERRRAVARTIQADRVGEVQRRHRVGLVELIAVACGRAGLCSSLRTLERDLGRSSSRIAPRVAPVAIERVLGTSGACSGHWSEELSAVRSGRGMDEAAETLRLAVEVVDRTDMEVQLDAAGLVVESWTDGSEHLLPEPILLKIALRGDGMVWEWLAEPGEAIHEMADALEREFVTLVSELETVAPRVEARDFPIASLDDGEVTRLLARYPALTDIWPLGAMQETMLLHGLVADSSGIYCHHLFWDFAGELDPRRLERALSEVLVQLPNLRVAFEHRETRSPVQIVLPTAHVPVRVETTEDVEVAYAAVVERDRAQGFDLSRPPLMRVTVLQSSAQHGRLVLCHHHLLFDGWSVDELFARILSAYEGRPGEEQAGVGFEDFLRWSVERSTNDAREHWTRYLAGARLPTPLGFQDRRVGRRASFRQAELERVWDAAFVEKLQQRARQMRVTPGAMLMTAWGMVLAAHAEREDVVFGVTGAGRPESLPDASKIVGLLINTIPLRFRASAEQTLAQHVERVQLEYAESRLHDQVSLRELADITGARASEFLPYETLVVFENFARAEGNRLRAGDLSFGPFEFTEQTNAPLALYVLLGDEWVLRTTFDANRFEPGTIRSVLGQLRLCLETLLDSPQRPLGEVTWVHPEHSPLPERSGPPEAVPTLSLPEVLAERARETPGRIAVVQGERRLTYAELHEWSRDVAHRLVQAGVQRGDRVALLCRRSPEWLAALYGILDVGAAYVPLDEAAPLERNRSILADASVRLVLADRLCEAQIPHGEVPLVLVEDVPRGVAREVGAGVSASDAAYVIYTSGSTGAPKGVVIRHESVVNYARAACDMYEWSKEDRILQFFSPSFDGSGEEVFGALWAGATLVLRPEDMLTTWQRFGSVLRDEEITTVSLPTAVWHAWVLSLAAHEEGSVPPPTLRTVIIGGERALPEKVSEWCSAIREEALGVRLFNTYGPTEATIVALTSELTTWDPRAETGREVPIGRPVAGAEAFVLDGRGHLAPLGAPGELHLAGPGLAEGYLHRPDLTAERFGERPGVQGTRLYRTGDRVRWRSDGQLEFLGRVDHQVKIRGYRVELGEIEAQLRALDGVEDCVVVDRVDADGSLRLAAYVVPSLERGRGVDAGWSRSLREALRASLPTYMIPSDFMALDALPLNERGKVDRQALPLPGATSAESAAEICLPRSELELKIARLWGEILGIADCDVHTEFFDVGGHSLTALRLLGRIQQELGVELSLRDLYRAPTIAGMALTIGAPRTEAGVCRAMEQDATMSLAAASVARSNVPMRAVLLTGVTGFLGSFLLGEILEATGAEVFCLVRAADAEAGRRRIEKALLDAGMYRPEFAARIRVVLGDLEAPRLGLDSSTYDELATQVETVLHSGARVSFVEPYESLRSANVLGTKEVIDFCSATGKPLHYVSTLAVYDPSRWSETIPEAWLSAECPELPSGYGQSKWVAERLVTRAMEAGLRASIYRPGRIGGHSGTGAWTEDDLACVMLGACSGVRRVPDLEMVVDLTPVDFVARAIVSSMAGGESGHLMHFVNPQGAALREVVGMLGKQGLALSRVPLKDWVEAVHEATGGDPMHPWFQLTLLLPVWQESLRPPQHGKPSFAYERTSALLEARDIHCPPVGPALLGTYLTRLRERGVIAASCGGGE